MANLDLQMKEYRLTTAQILYRLPDYEQVLQEFIWQDYDIAPKFPNLYKFLDFWENEIEGALHSVYVAKKKLISTGDYRFSRWHETIR